MKLINHNDAGQSPKEIEFEFRVRENVVRVWKTSWPKDFPCP